jgi:thiopeptide-type bacteriocin biosynthesis protein
LERICASDSLPLPDAFSVIAAVAAANQTAMDNGDFRVALQGVFGPSGARYLGRFCHIDKTLNQKVESHLRAEEFLRPDAVFAEIVHLPEGRLGNILARPILRAYEIPFLGRGGLAADYQIPISDLYVSVREKRIVLHSARLGREIIPRLTSAHNFTSRSLGIYQFLCFLQGQGVAENFKWTWGALEAAPFLPRVTMRRLVLARARWNMTEKELKALDGPTASARFGSVNSLRARLRLPRLMMVFDGDNSLPIDFDNTLSVETFVDLARGRKEVRLVEMFPPSEQLCVSGPEGRFIHELIVPFVRKDGEEKPRAVLPYVVDRAGQKLDRTFPPGSEWLYFKLYTGSATADQLLREKIGPLVAELFRSGAIDRWFFVRYGDPEWHLRLRFHGAPDALHAEVLPAIQAFATPLLAAGWLWRCQLDTYEREIERYGGAQGIVLAEQIFHVDSEAALEIIETLEAGDTGLDERWRLTLRGIDLLLDDFGFDLRTKLTALSKAHAEFAKEFHVDAKLKKQIGCRFRKERASLEAALDASHSAEGGFSAGFEILRRRSARLAPIVCELKGFEANRQLSTPLEKLALSCLHMHANRLLRSAQRENELVLYSFLTRLNHARLRRVES